MEYKREFNIDEFEFWGGAFEVAHHATEEQMAAIEERLESIFYDEIPSETEINDFVWFECDDIVFGEVE